MTFMEEASQLEGKPLNHLVGVLQNKSQGYESRQAAAWAIGKLGAKRTSSAEVLAEMVEALTEVVADRSNHYKVRGMAIDALGKLGMAAISALPVLRTFAEDADQDSSIRYGAKAAIRSIGGGVL
jgi:HEAT repeat protein